LGGKGGEASGGTLRSLLYRGKSPSTFAGKTGELSQGKKRKQCVSKRIEEKRSLALSSAQGPPACQGGCWPTETKSSVKGKLPHQRGEAPGESPRSKGEALTLTELTQGKESVDKRREGDSRREGDLFGDASNGASQREGGVSVWREKTNPDEEEEKGLNVSSSRGIPEKIVYGQKRKSLHQPSLPEPRGSRILARKTRVFQ